jgi:predicted AlkP superfamily pyrophosphatase or phosphodiesterase
MIRSRLSTILVLVLLACRPPLEGPRLVVVISVDQMRADYVERFDDRFTGGFARLLRDGAVFGDAHQDHAMTSTAPGHATIATGAFPSRHGFIQNDWYDRNTAQWVYSVDDPTAAIIGNPEAPGRSPVNLSTNTLGDWLKRRSRGSKVFSVAIKDRAAIPMGGKEPNGVYWYHSSTGQFVTSVYYQRRNPNWVDRFNAAEPAAAYNGSIWDRLFPESTYVASREDDFPHEADGRGTTFPHWIGVEEDDGGWKRFYELLRRSPFADELTFDFVRELVVNEELGADDRPDILFVGCSAADYVGHAYGPYSQEVEDYYLRLDRQLDSLFVFLDQTVGRPNNMVVLTGDHGVMTMPEELARRGFGGARVSKRGLGTLAKQAIDPDTSSRRYRDSLRVRIANGVVILFPGGTSEQDQAAARRAVAAALRESPAILEAYTLDELILGRDGDRPYFGAFRRSFDPDRSPDVVFAAPDTVLITNLDRETSHGTPHPFDSHVPLIFAGPGIAPSYHPERVRTVDIAPTLAAILGVRPMGTIDGRVLEGVGNRSEE